MYEIQKKPTQALPPEIQEPVSETLRDLEDAMQSAPDGASWTTLWASYADVQHRLDQEGGN